MPTKLLFAGLVAGSLALCGCGSDKENLLAGLRATEKLSVLECHFSKTILAQKQNDFFSKDDYYYARVFAKVKYELNLSKIEDKDIQVSGEKVKIRLPRLETSTFEDLARTTSVDTASDSPFEYFGHLLRPRRTRNMISRHTKDSLRADALKQIHTLASSDTSALYRRSAQEADSLLRSILTGLGYKKEHITIVHK